MARRESVSTASWVRPDAVLSGCTEVNEGSAGGPGLFKYLKSVSEESRGVYVCYAILMKKLLMVKPIGNLWANQDIYSGISAKQNICFADPT